MIVQGRVVEWRRILGGAVDHALLDGGQRSACGTESVSWVLGLSGRRCRTCASILAGSRTQPAGQWGDLPPERREILDAVFLAGALGIRIAFHRDEDREWLGKSGYARHRGDPPRWYITERGVRAHAHYQR